MLQDQTVKKVISKPLGPSGWYMCGYLEVYPAGRPVFLPGNPHFYIAVAYKML